MHFSTGLSRVTNLSSLLFVVLQTLKNFKKLYKVYKNNYSASNNISNNYSAWDSTENHGDNNKKHDKQQRNKLKIKEWSKVRYPNCLYLQASPTNSIDHVLLQ